MSNRELRAVADFVEVPEEELYRCLQAFRLAVLKTKAARAAAEAQGRAPDGIRLEAFQWNPRAGIDLPMAPPSGTTPLEELPLRHSVRVELRRMRVFCLEDFSEVTEQEFAVMPDVGTLTVEAIRSRLARVGLTFKPDPDSDRQMGERHRLAQRIPPEQRLATITDSSPVADLGLATTTFGRARQQGHHTVAELRALSVRDLTISYGAKQAMEILTTLRQAGLDLHAAPSNAQLWAAGLLPRSELTMPSDLDAPLIEIAPWIGRSLAQQLCAKNYIVTIRDLVRAVETKEVAKLPNVGPKTYADLLNALSEAGFLRKAGDEHGATVSTIR